LVEVLDPVLTVEQDHRMGMCLEGLQITVSGDRYPGVKTVRALPVMDSRMGVAGGGLYSHAASSFLCSSESGGTANRSSPTPGPA
jgi:hypothetical protein